MAAESRPAIVVINLATTRNITLRADDFDTEAIFNNYVRQIKDAGFAEIRRTAATETHAEEVCLVRVPRAPSKSRK